MGGQGGRTLERRCDARSGGATERGGSQASVTAQRRPTLRPGEHHAVILSVIPLGTTRKTGGDQVDGTADLSCKDGAAHYVVEPTHNRSFEDSSLRTSVRKDDTNGSDIC